jgi:hypothetical protein
MTSKYSNSRNVENENVHHFVIICNIANTESDVSYFVFQTCVLSFCLFSDNDHINVVMSEK